ncbi:MAG: hypothetical protein CM15mP47_2500 [Methanobacteriota archaeon]|nr:MAG: hypothetical protein CM15mP47_2500 [Euryarchaeota archaeon]
MTMGNIPPKNSSIGFGFSISLENFFSKKNPFKFHVTTGYLQQKNQREEKKQKYLNPNEMRYMLISKKKPGKGEKSLTGL